jgi:nucleoside phosphorylase
MEDALMVQQRQSNTPCAVILTALSIEYLAVRSHLTNLKEVFHPQGTIYEQGTFTSNGQNCDVIVGEIGAGNSTSALEASKAIEYFKPDVILFVGIAVGIKDVMVGDVVVATKVYGYEIGQLSGETFYPRPDVVSSSYLLEQRARSEARKNDWLKRLSTYDPTPNVFIAPIASGDKIISSRKSSAFEFLRSHYNDAIAVEMEGFGFLKATQAYPQVLAIAIRGISDLIDSNKDNNGLKIASLHASAFAFETG